METKKSLCFKGVPLNTGDIVQITPTERSGYEIGMAVIDLLDEEGTSLLVLLQQDDAQLNQSPLMELKDSEILSLRVVMEADEAVINHSRERFRLYERIIYQEGEARSGGKVIAAFDGLVAAELNLGEIVVKDATFFESPPTLSRSSPSEEFPSPLPVLQSQ